MQKLPVTSLFLLTFVLACCQAYPFRSYNSRGLSYYYAPHFQRRESMVIPRFAQDVGNEDDFVPLNDEPMLKRSYFLSPDPNIAIGRSDSSRPGK
uniref:Neuropeptide-Like Protein n=1 Tax=Plectus sambesii TaxID=2011161 RepID=A0A914VBX6_9BILA